MTTDPGAGYLPLARLWDMETTQRQATMPNQTRFNFDRPAVDLSEPLLTAGEAAAMLTGPRLSVHHL